MKSIDKKNVFFQYIRQPCRRPYPELLQAIPLMLSGIQ